MDSHLALFDLIGALARRRRQTAEKSFSALGLNHTEARLLTLLREEGDSAGQETLAGRLFIDRSNAGRSLKRLEQEGYIVRIGDESDKRAKVVQMTAKGRKAVGEIARLRKKTARSFFGELSDEEAGAIVSLLQKTLPSEECERLRRRLEQEAVE